jgi:large subunit ribosomal protein L31
MKSDLHPKYEAVTFTCSCGNQLVTKSALCKDMQIEVCAKCHPFYTGKQKIVDTSGQVDKFNKRFARYASKPVESEEVAG